MRFTRTWSASPNHRTLEFAQYLAKKNINVWIRYVVVPGWSDDDDSAHRLGEFTRDMGNVEKIELLPYHELGKHKWVAMGEEYKLDGVHPAEERDHGAGKRHPLSSMVTK
ncbi:pyruvate formate-lyase activating enzyme [Klebsiella pneumoniae subsp. ozaenae]|uniref:Pyruvate formate-lyase activating enzyme n=1 Tax=Klebsiella pneumoniae subsp. ozaenae TaxID=574 RepID=A0A378BNI5_KLEPO|nr:pyruvate formate-lyase activating enzyme [Klebsiella pneumoniae subsp. ozaenae]